MNLKERKLYLVTDYNIEFPKLLEKIEEAVKCGVTIVQYRAKNSSTRIMCKEALAIKEICHKYNAIFIVNDRVDVALAVDADGVHLGQDDMEVYKAKELLPSGKIIGATVHNKEEAIEAVKQGADNLGVGAIYTTTTKDDAKPISVETLMEIRECTDIAIYGIGGITEKNITEELKKNINGVAIVSAILNSSDINKTCDTILQNLNRIKC